MRVLDVDGREVHSAVKGDGERSRTDKPFAISRTPAYGSTPMATNIFLDSDVWDFLFDRKIDLAVEFPRDQFRLFVTREAEFEIPHIPEPKKTFVEAAIAKCEIGTDTVFGFFDDLHPTEEQRVGGFDQGRWGSQEEVNFRASETPSASIRPTKLYKNEADVSLAGRSFLAHSAVLTLNRKGPLKRAHEKGGKVVFLNDFDSSGLSLRGFVLKAIT